MAGKRDGSRRVDLDVAAGYLDRAPTRFDPGFATKCLGALQQSGEIPAPDHSRSAMARLLVSRLPALLRQTPNGHCEATGANHGAMMARQPQKDWKASAKDRAAIWRSRPAASCSISRTPGINSAREATSQYIARRSRNRPSHARRPDLGFSLLWHDDLRGAGTARARDPGCRQRLNGNVRARTILPASISALALKARIEIPDTDRRLPEMGMNPRKRQPGDQRQKPTQSGRRKSA